LGNDCALCNQVALSKCCPSRRATFTSSIAFGGTAAGAEVSGMDRAYEDNETRQLALDFGFIPVVPPKSNRLEPWQYDQALYRKRNEVERLFRRLKGFRRIFSRFDKLDALFLGFLNFALIVEALR